jgi:DNA-binding CsgD family transcriptional regulator/ArsR family metal-binding transcriptional regulator
MAQPLQDSGKKMTGMPPLLDGFKEISISKAGVMSLASEKSWGAHFELETDIRTVFPYVNSVIPETRYHDQPEYIIFSFEGITCTLYPNDMVAAPFNGRDAASAFGRKLIRFLNDIYVRRHEIVPNHRRYRPVSVVEIYRLLPRTNCGDCGYPTCLSFAGALRQGRTAPDQCPGFAAPIHEYAVYPVYDNDGNLVSTITLEINDEGQKETPDRGLEVIDAEPSPGDAKAPIGADTQLGHPPLTHREKEVLRLLAGGETNNAISEILSISPHTVKSHVIHIFNKLGVNDRTQAAVLAAKNDLI